MNKQPMNVPTIYQRVGLKASIKANSPNTDSRVTGAITLILNNVPNRNVMITRPF